MKRYYSNKLYCLWLLLFLITCPGIAQQMSIKGTVTGENGSPVPDAMVIIKDEPGTKVFTDKDGKFTITGETDQVLEVRTRDNHMKSQRVTSEEITFAISDDDEMIPLGNRLELRKEDITSAIGYVKANELTKSSVWNPANSLYGKIPGLTVLQNGGTNWNSNPEMYIRGIETFGIGSFVNTNILVMVDGFERPISSLSMAEIESVAILKDAAALSMYGLRGANGVMVVTTKRGTGTGLSIDVNYEYGVSHATRLPDFLDAYDYALAVNQASINDGTTELYTQTDLDRFQTGSSPYFFPDVNWLDEGLNDFGNSDKLSIAFQEQAKSVRYFAVINFDHENGLLGPVSENEGYTTKMAGRRTNFRTNVDIDLTRSLQFTLNIAGNLSFSNRPGTAETDIFSALYNTPSAVYPVMTYDNIFGGTSTYNNNPVALISATGYIEEGTRELMSDFILDQKLNKVLNGLSVEAGLSFDRSFNYRDAYTKQFQYQAVTPIMDPVTGDITDTVETLYGTNTTLTFATSVPSQWRRTTYFADLKYSKDWGKNHLSSILLFQQEELVKSGQSNTYRHLLVAGNVHYSRAEKYFADVSLSYNGTNILPEGSRYGLFPAVSLAWKLSNEEFLAGSKVVNNLKVRASWGLTGSDQVIQNIDQNVYVGSGTYYFQSNNTSFGGYRENRLASSPLTYETSNKSNIGVDAGLFGVIDISLDAFYNKRTGILVETTGSISDLIGIDQPYSSTGITTNMGMELGLNLHDNIGDFNYHLSGQFAYSRNKILEMEEEFRPYDYLKRTGQRINQIFGLEAIGFFEDATDILNSPKQTFSVVKPGDIKYKDQNEDNVINSFDEVPVGYSSKIPELYFSGSVGVEYKGIGLEAFFQGIANRTVYLNTSSLFWPLRTNTTITTFSDDAWTPATAATAKLPRLSMTENVNNYRSNTIWNENGSYLKLRSIELYYNFPVRLISKLKIGELRLYVRGMNPFSIDNIKCVDPEAIGIIYPTVSSYNFGIQVGF